MSSANIITTNHGVFQEFLMLIGKMVYSRLIKEMEYLKVENQIMRKKLNKYIRLTPTERRRILKFEYLHR